MAFEAELLAERGGLLDAQKLGVALGAFDLAVAAGVQLDDRRAELHRHLELARIGLDEQRDADAGVAQPRDQRLQVIVLADRVEAALGGPLLALLGHDAGGMRAMAQRDRHHLLGRRHLEIERQVDRVHQAGDVVVDDVAAILAQVRGDAVGAGLGRELGGAQRIGRGRAARVAHGGDVIDVHAETLAGKRGHFTHSVHSNSIRFIPLKLRLRPRGGKHRRCVKGEDHVMI